MTQIVLVGHSNKTMNVIWELQRAKIYTQAHRQAYKIKQKKRRFSDNSNWQSGSSAMQITANAIAHSQKQCFDFVNGHDCITTIIADFVATDGQVFNAQCLLFNVYNKLFY